jgi:hypothetical protein
MVEEARAYQPRWFNIRPLAFSLLPNVQPERRSRRGRLNELPHAPMLQGALTLQLVTPIVRVPDALLCTGTSLNAVLKRPRRGLGSEKSLRTTYAARSARSPSVAVSIQSRPRRLLGTLLLMSARFYARSFGKAQRDEARDRLLEYRFGAVSDAQVEGPLAPRPSDDELSREVGRKHRNLLQMRRFRKAERTGIEPVTSGLPTHPIAQLHLTPTDGTGVAEPKSLVLSNAIRHGLTKLRSHSARTAGG